MSSNQQQPRRPSPEFHSHPRFTDAQLDSYDENRVQIYGADAAARRHPSEEVRRDYYAYSHCHASTRSAFLVNHPYGYEDAWQRADHEEYADRAAAEAKKYRRVYDTHLSGASVSEPTARPAYPPYGTYNSMDTPTPRRDPHNGQYYGGSSGAGRGYGSYGSGSSSRN
ncbi:hypothetical protein FALBO_112 [Fusarium albosuccineum]|uniref:Uncharacterized protein n=1 Tax=Fusarium albosuccineum TaxID=1237068 RepID=A0A8H4PHD7_9HYPO|nr:hypothetical protein FALBO_112 [Fusarium albosuccineum]